MCGIIGAAASHDVVPALVHGLQQLQYRGYDSCGIAVLSPDTLRGGPVPPCASAIARASICRLRSVGRVSALQKRLLEQTFQGQIGIAHTRWATHGEVNEFNAHPLLSSGEGLQVSVVHNGIIENYEVLRMRLSLLGYTFGSDTDSEVIAHWLHYQLTQGTSLFEAMQQLAGTLEGDYAIAAIASSDPSAVVGLRHGAPLLLGVHAELDAYFIASDLSALHSLTQRVSYLEDGDCVRLHPDGYTVVSTRQLQVNSGTSRVEPVIRTFIEVDQETPSMASTSLGHFDHFMQKEIAEQPEALAKTLGVVERPSDLCVDLFGSGAEEVFRRTQRILILACGTSLHAGQIAKHWLESLAKIPVDVEVASEYCDSPPLALPGTLVITISQSGETADTIAASKHARVAGLLDMLAIGNVPGSWLQRNSSLQFLTRAGLEIGVAATKSFTTQLAALFLLAIVLGRHRQQLSDELVQALYHQAKSLPQRIRQITETCQTGIQNWSEMLCEQQPAMFLGRALHFPVALEGALKLKEIAYIPAQGYPAGELKHGPLALIGPKTPVIATVPNNALAKKLRASLEEIQTREGCVWALTETGTGLSPSRKVKIIDLGTPIGILSPVLHTIPLQWLAYHTGCRLGTDVDKPRNLAKSVTVA